MHRQGNPSGAVASIPADAFAGSCHGLTIYPAQVAVNPVIAVAAVVRGLEYKLSVDQSVVAIVTQHDVVPDEVNQRHISQIDDVVGISVDFIAIEVQIVKRSVKERSEGDAQDPVDDGGASVGVPSSGDYGAIPYQGSRTIGTCGRRQGTTPTPAVVGIVVVEVVAIVVVAIVEVVVVIIAMTIVVRSATTIVAIVAIATAAILVLSTAIVVAHIAIVTTIRFSTVMAVIHVTVALVAAIGSATTVAITLIASVGLSTALVIVALSGANGSSGGAAVARSQTAALANSGTLVRTAAQ